MKVLSVWYFELGKLNKEYLTRNKTARCLAPAVSLYTYNMVSAKGGTPFNAIIKRCRHVEL